MSDTSLTPSTDPHVNGLATDLVNRVLQENENRVRESMRKIVNEASMDFFGILNNGLDPYDMMQDLSGWSSYPYVVPPYYRQGQKRGEVLPVYLDENQLRFLRDRSRKLCAENPFALAAIENRVNYTVGKDGLVIKAVKGHPACPDRLLRKVQRVIDLWQEANDMPEVEADIITQGAIDGEAFQREFEQDSGVLLLRPVEPEHVRSPAGDAYGPRHSFGIETDPRDIFDRKGYWIVEDPINDPRPVFVPAREVSHFKYNTPRSAKRGLPLFYSCEVLLRSAMDLLRGVVTTANVRARYAVVRKFGNGVVREAAQRMMAELTTATVTDPTSGQATNVVRRPFGAEVSIGANQDILFPGSNLDAAVYETALQMTLRAVAARCSMPEWMFTSDASGANYASSLVAEAPSTKSFERQQTYLIKRIGVNRAKGKESLCWRQIQAAVRKRVLPPETLTLVALSAEGPSLEVRDKGAEASTNKTYLEMRVKPPQMIQQELGIDTERANEMFKEWDRQQQEALAQAQQMAARQQAQMGGGAPPGAPGAGAVGVPGQPPPQAGPQGAPGQQPPPEMTAQGGPPPQGAPQGGPPPEQAPPQGGVVPPQAAEMPSEGAPAPEPELTPDTAPQPPDVASLPPPVLARLEKLARQMGVTVEELLRSGQVPPEMLELTERDALNPWWHGVTRGRPEVRLVKGDDGVVRTVVDRPTVESVSPLAEAVADAVLGSPDPARAVLDAVLDDLFGPVA